MNVPVVCIITTYGRPDRVVDALKSIIGQDYRPLEVIVVDDNLPDSDDARRTREVLEPLLSECSGHLVSTGGRQGAPVARNLGAAETSSDFLAFLDDDDLWRPSKTSLQLSALMDAGEAAVFSYCNLDYIDDADRIIAKKRVPPGRIRFEPILLKSWPPHPA
jgi:glycosyltransferase involved in cell wall biosynthesis